MLLSVGTGLVFVGLWELLPALGVVDPFFVSSPSRRSRPDIGCSRTGFGTIFG